MEVSALSLLLQERDMRLVDLARAVGVDKSTVTRWARKNIPDNRVPDVAKATGIPPHELRPDLATIFGSAPTPERAAS
jgi:hypothetical protein